MQHAKAALFPHSWPPQLLHPFHSSPCPLPLPLTLALPRPYHTHFNSPTHACIILPDAPPPPKNRAALSKALVVTARRWAAVVAPGEADRLAPVVESLSQRYLGPDYSDPDKRGVAGSITGGWRKERCVRVRVCVCGTHSLGKRRGLFLRMIVRAGPASLMPHHGNGYGERGGGQGWGGPWIWFIGVA
jgi:hypothetical protein